MARARKISKERRPMGTWILRIIKAGVIAGLLGVMVLGIFVAIARGEIDSFEDLKASPNGQMIRVRAADGTVIQSLGPSFGRWLDIDQLPSEMKDAMVAVEDRRYYIHPGVDPIGITRSLYVRAIDGRWTQGGSTITQQLARNIYLNSNKEFGRKIREVILALAMETKFSKDQILELYLNKVYFGGGAYGVDAASRKFFDHGAENLSLAEAAIIAGLVKAPSHYSPTADAQAAIDRATVVVGVMQDAGMISAAEAAEVKPADVKMAKQQPQDSVRYFTDWVLPQLDGLIDETEKPIDVWTTLDLKMQRAATAAIAANAPRGAQGALVSIDRDGAVKAMVGGTDYVTSNYNRAVTAVRQPGSAWKLFVYLAALEAGLRPEDMVEDKPVEIEGWQPKNSNGQYAGEISLRTAFAYSKNTVAAQLGQEVGTSSIANMARRFGITTPINTQPSMVLGTSETRVIDMTQAFASVGSNGRSITPYGISKVTTIDGEILYTAKPSRSVQLVEDWVAAAMTDLMQTAVATGTGRAANIGRPVAGKTGTTSSNKDGWFLGFSSGLTTGVWMGRDDARAIGGLEGGRAPAQAWAAYMRVAVSGRPVENFATEVTFPEQLEGEDLLLGEGEEGLLLDENGMPIEGDPALGDPDAMPDTDPEPLDDAFIERAIGGRDPRSSRDEEGVREPQ
ncbi:MAG: penicillin-binding protein [Sphingomonadales bacterium 35-56-22]|jgi:penicillin-binding protein 1A|uniref:transglycosylase domain-containing protein n=1 Tax=Sphingorhabdus sp. TaxID=1902408 RepID=UPI000BDBDC6A|nr:PBP1A family penicillin-binding protein [Sphingorhabdus sp.]OYY14952.1 MAG: penicillin-binding protein [Sphingomonadales bacterium 35-56-22]OYY97278.1 MAG: penicillin-binding protein [Sphingomonadales bacterium 28-56-43]OYZ60082.1 MAG: penicillin-binding protein [Sphingomonadales bacterium 24-56-14]OZA82361.1 MAG: penicillin-binding protein [Sphingomonadales bacterium 39-57-19]HQS12834.1 PBP1A family penicillin-binding protein [Sphingorhabdus sp.]